MKKIIFFFGLVCTLSLYSQGYKTGITIDSISVENSTNETFALYLPKNYEEEKLSPILFIFSPSGKGNQAISVFKKAAEAYNYILVCSNNSRNGPYDRNFAVAERLFNHVFAHFNIANNRIYLAGFSGGSRMASSIASLTGQIEGVIACGAGFASVPSYQPLAQDFEYAAICGDRDMNYKEMLDVTAYLNGLKFRNTLFTFDGNHSWPPDASILMAFEWFEIEAHKKGYLKKSEKELLNSYKKNYSIAKSSELNKRSIRAVEHYQHIVKTYGSFFNLDSINNRISSIKKSKIYVSSFASRERTFEKEAVLGKKLIDRYIKDYKNPEKAKIAWWDKELKKLDRIDSNGNLEFSKMKERLQFMLFAAVYERTGSDVNASSAQAEFRKAIVLKLRKRLFQSRQ